jgi:hypothetical protein
MSLEQYNHQREIVQRYSPLLEDLGIRTDGMEPMDLLLLHAHIVSVEHFSRQQSEARARWEAAHPEVPEAHKQMQAGEANIDWPRTLVARMTIEERKALVTAANKNSPVAFAIK